MNIEQIMTSDVKFISSAGNLNQAAQLMWEADCGALPVVDEDNQIIGILTDRDMAMAAYTQGDSLANISVVTAMAKVLFTCKPEDSIEQVLATMGDKQIRRVPVVNDDNQVVGIVALNDMAIACKQNRKNLAATALADTLAAICAPREVKEEAAETTSNLTQETAKAMAGEQVNTEELEPATA